MADLREQLQATLGAAYSIDRELGGGGMSRVFVAEETALGRKVVIKVLPPELVAGANLERFNREILLAARLQHPHIVPVLAAGETNGLPYYTMPFVEGESLRTKLARRDSLSISSAVAVLRDVAKALAYAHERGIVHRDIKPDNVLLTGGSATVTDFGIAKAISASRTFTDRSTLTQVGTSLGTPAYMAPEQAAGDPETNHRADIYAFGCTAYEILAGRPPFTEKSPRKLLAAQMTDRPTAISALRRDVPPPLATLVMRCLEKDPDARPQHASDLLLVLDALTSASAAHAPWAVGGEATLRRILLLCGAMLLALTALVRAGTAAKIGLPLWVFPASLITLGVELPLILFTAYVEHVARRALASTDPSIETPSLATGGFVTLAVKASSRTSGVRRVAEIGVYLLGGFVLVVVVLVAVQTMGIRVGGSPVASDTSPSPAKSVGAARALERDSAHRDSVKAINRSDMPPKQSGEEGRGTASPLPMRDSGPRALQPKVAAPEHDAFVSVSTGGRHTCALTRDRHAYCWGYGYAGQLGNGLRNNSVAALAVSGGLTFAELESGNTGTCGLTTDGATYCWGQDADYDAWGTAHIVNPTPRRVADDVSFAALAAGLNHACGLTANGAAFCWGAGGAGQLGDGSRVISSSQPVAVLGGLRFASLSAGNAYTCGVTRTGAAYCWGSDSFGRLGRGEATGVSPATPELVVGDLSFTTVSTGFYHTCGVTTRGAAYCWGADSAGQLGSGTIGVPTGAPVAVAGNLKFASLTLGTVHTCGVTTNGAAYCWGQNGYGQLGDGTTSQRSAPVAVVGGLTFSMVSAHWGLTCGATTSGDAYCWGGPTMGAVNERALTPMRVGQPP